MSKKDFTLELSEALFDKTKAAPVIEQIQKELDDLVKTNQNLLDQCKENIELAHEYKKANVELNKSQFAFIEILKHMQLVLNSEKELVQNSEKLNRIREKLNEHVVGSNFIKAGVLSKGFKNAN